MKTVIGYTQSEITVLRGFKEKPNNERPCPSCGFETLRGMAGGKEAVCTNCGYKDPCCYD